MEEKNLVTLPEEVANYLEYMKKHSYTLIGALKVASGSSELEKDFMDTYFVVSYNQEKFARAWLDGYKTEEKFYRVKLKYFKEGNAYLNVDEDDNSFFFGDIDELIGFKTKFTKKFLEDNYLDWMLDSEGIMLLEVEE